jgi:hypothetical protein
MDNSIQVVAWMSFESLLNSVPHRKFFRNLFYPKVKARGYKISPLLVFCESICFFFNYLIPNNSFFIIFQPSHSSLLSLLTLPSLLFIPQLLSIPLSSIRFVVCTRTFLESSFLFLLQV